jgi:hypothetical protein
MSTEGSGLRQGEQGGESREGRAGKGEQGRESREGRAGKGEQGGESREGHTLGLLAVAPLLTQHQATLAG